MDATSHPIFLHFLVQGEIPCFFHGKEASSQTHKSHWPKVSKCKQNLQAQRSNIGPENPVKKLWTSVTSPAEPMSNQRTEAKASTNTASQAWQGTGTEIRLH